MPAGARRNACAAALLCALAACGGGPVMIGDAYPRGARSQSIADVAQGALDSQPGAHVSIERWKVTNSASMAQAFDGALQFTTNPNVLGVVGHAGSRESLIGAKYYNAIGVTQIVPNSTARRLTSAGTWTFRLVPDDSVEGVFLAAYAIDSIHAGRVQLFYVGDEYGVGIRDGVSSELRARGIPVLDATMLPGRGCGGQLWSDAHRFPVLAALRRSRPDVVIFGTGSADAACLVQLVAEGAPNAVILGADGFVIAHDELAKLPERARARLRTVSFWQPDENAASRAFIARWHRLFAREPDDVDALVYDGFLLLGKAVRDGGSSRRAVKRYVESLGGSRPPFEGVTGPISFDHGRRVGLKLRMVPPVHVP